MPEDGCFSFRMQTFSRYRERADGMLKRCSAVAKAAYQAAEAIPDDRLGATHNYTRKIAGVMNKALVGYKGLPAKFLESRAKLWNMVNSAEVRKNAKICRSIIVSLPHQLSKDDQWDCLMKFAQYLAERYRIVVDVAHHSPDQTAGHDKRNWHAHILMPRREITEEGYLASNNSFTALDKKWLSGDEVKILRQRFADIQNEMLALRGIDVVMDPRSYAERGIEQIPTQHRGPGGQAMAERDIRPESKTQLDAKGREIDYGKIDEGRTRPEFNGEIIELNAERALEGPLPLSVQIMNLERLIEVLFEKVTDLEAVIPASMLPMWARLLVERYKLKARDLIDSFMQAKAEEEDEEDEKKRERVGVHEQMRRMREQLKELQHAKETRQALQRLYTRIDAVMVMRPPIEADWLPPPREISNAQFNVELHFKAETARAQVPPEYRPRIERPVEVLPETRTGQGVQFAAAARAPPADNGGLAQAPPPMTATFNAVADPGPEPYKAKVRVGFGMG